MKIKGSKINIPWYRRRVRVAQGEMITPFISDMDSDGRINRFRLQPEAEPVTVPETEPVTVPETELEPSPITEPSPTPTPIPIPDPIPLPIPGKGEERERKPVWEPSPIPAPIPIPSSTDILKQLAQGKLPTSWEIVKPKYEPQQLEWYEDIIKNIELGAMVAGRKADEVYNFLANYNYEELHLPTFINDATEEFGVIAAYILAIYIVGQYILQRRLAGLLPPINLNDDYFQDYFNQKIEI